MVAAVQSSSRGAGAGRAVQGVAAVGGAPAFGVQPPRPRAGWGDQGPAAGVLLAVTVSLPLWVLVVALARMIIA